MTSNLHRAGPGLRLFRRLPLVVGFAVSLLLADAPLAGTWRTGTGGLTITEVALRTYRIEFGDQAMTLGLVPEDTTIACDGKEKPLPGAAKPGTTAFCGRTYPTAINIRLRENGTRVGELDFHLTDTGSLRYVITKAGHDTAFLLQRQ
jgi:hypothetical protein